jgi:hypothetical protein
VVVVYYLVFIAFAAFLLWLRGPEKYGRLLPMSYVWATMLGGLTFSGPVRLFSEWQRKFKIHPAWANDPHPVAPWLPRAVFRFDPVDHLDEHDIAARDRAHYLAYSTLRWPAIAAAIIAPIFLMETPPEQVARILYVLSVPVAALFFSLPQALLLWTEPDLEPDSADTGTQNVFKAIP